MSSLATRAMAAHAAEQTRDRAHAEQRHRERVAMVESKVRGILKETPTEIRMDSTVRNIADVLVGGYHFRVRLDPIRIYLPDNDTWEVNSLARLGAVLEGPNPPRTWDSLDEALAAFEASRPDPPF